MRAYIYIYIYICMYTYACAHTYPQIPEQAEVKIYNYLNMGGHRYKRAEKYSR